MPLRRNAASEISYASSASTRAGRAVIRSVEHPTGRRRLIRLARDYEREVAEGRDFGEVTVERHRVPLDLIGGSLADIPRDGPLVVVANHSYGILDGLVLGHIMSRSRGEFRILAHRVFRKAGALEKSILPVSFDDGREAQARNLATGRAALASLADDARAMMDHLRAETYRLSPRPIGDPAYGFEFEDAR